MTALAVVLAFCLVAVAAFTLWGASKVTRRTDALAARLTGQPPIPSRTPLDAIDRLSAVAADGPPAPTTELEVRRYRASLGAIDLGALILDEHGQTIYQNSFAAEFVHGRHGDAVVGESIDHLSRLALEGSTADTEVSLYGPPRRTLSLSASPIRENDRLLGAVVLIDDITEHERLEAVRRDFVANISHELKTPIGALSLLAETLADEPHADDVGALAGRLQAEAARLSSTVDDLLELSRIEHGTDDNFGPVVVQNAVAAVVDRVRSSADQLGIDVGVVMPDDELVVRGDQRQLMSALYNLLDNALKYTGIAGSLISIRGRRIDDVVEVAVQDDGVGIPTRDLSRVFERFYRVDRARNRSTGGTGLGLAIVRHVVVNHGGRIEVDSTEGTGSTFTVLLPALTADSASALEGAERGDDHEEEASTR